MRQFPISVLIEEHGLDDFLIEADAEKYRFLKHYEGDLPGLFIVSQVELKGAHDLPQTPDFKVSVTKAEGIKCERCWKYTTDVGSGEKFPTVCEACCEALKEMGL